MPLTVGVFDGAHFMLGALKQIFPAECNARFLVNPGTNAATQLNLIIYSLFGNRHKKFVGVCPSICISGEPLNLRGMGFTANVLIDCKIVPAFQIVPRAKFYYLPFYVTSFSERYKNRPEDLLTPKNAAAIAATKTKFCAFLYSKENAHRNRMFDALTRVGAAAGATVDALGKCRNRNPRPITDRSQLAYNDLAVQKYKPYKFVIACENTRLKGYITEKIVSAMLAGAIPIYYGAPDIAEHFNPKSFIDASVPNWEKQVLELDRNPELYKQMLAEPWCVGDDGNPTLNRYFDVKHILEGVLTDVKILLPPPPQHR